MTYNILYGGKKREEAIHAVLAQMQADGIVLQEVREPAIVEMLGQRLGMQPFVIIGSYLRASASARCSKRRSGTRYSKHSTSSACA